ncbi:MAG: 5-oxoprolinase subunit A 3 [Catillopecten margaritatus gill symbiont]|uniref:5-oxoprolinase subunit A 3 n=1 Tax=Catillopecten margaritatus gill symbiont TaxID=3083288 RepID=A0AAU6PFN0_9GAMM
MLKKRINCDLGECLTPSPDGIAMPLIDMANIACGGHAGDDESMTNTIQLAKQHQVTIGAHPSYADKSNFGRVSQPLEKCVLFGLLHTQIAYFKTLCSKNDATLEYIKPHGALYHDMMHNAAVFDALCKAIQSVDDNLKLVVQAGIKTPKTDLCLLFETYADRGYQGLKMLPRTEKGALLTDADAIVAQYHHFLNNSTMQIDTICFHSDNPASIKALQKLSNA